VILLLIINPLNTGVIQTLTFDTAKEVTMQSVGAYRIIATCL